MEETNFQSLSQVLDLLGPFPEPEPGQAAIGRWIETALKVEADEEASETSGQWVVGAGGLDLLGDDLNQDDVLDLDPNRTTVCPNFPGQPPKLVLVGQD